MRFLPLLAVATLLPLLTPLLCAQTGEVGTLPTNQPASEIDTNQAAIQAQHRDGEKALSENRFADAVKIYNTILAQDDEDIDAHFNLALAYSMLGQDTDAIPHYEAVLKERPDIFEAKINLGQSLLRAGDPAGAVPILQAAAEQHPEDFRPTYFLAESLLETGQNAEAETTFKAALAIAAAQNIGAAPAEFGYARSLLRQGMVDEAEPHYRAAVELDPELQSTLLELAQGYEKYERPAEALRIYREFPDNIGATEHAGALALQLGEAEQAAEALEAAVAEDPTRGNRMGLAQAYLDLGRLVDAQKQVQAVLAEIPDDVSLRLLNAQLYRDQRQFPLASNEFRKITVLDPENGDAWGELGNMLMLEEKYLDAVDAYNRLDAMGKAKPGHYFFRAVAHDRLQEDEEAVDDYEKFLSLSQNESPDQEFQARQRIQILKRKP